MKGLGRLFNVVAVASGLSISLKNASGVTFIGKQDTAATVYTFTQTIAGASSVTLLLDPDYYAGGGIGGVWTHVAATGTKIATLTKGAGAGENCICFYVGANELTDGYDSVKCTAGGGTLVAIVHDLLIQRDPANLPVSAV